jgi:hypothetical protein
MPLPKFRTPQRIGPYGLYYRVEREIQAGAAVGDHAAVEQWEALKRRIHPIVFNLAPTSRETPKNRPDASFYRFMGTNLLWARYAAADRREQRGQHFLEWTYVKQEIAKVLNERGEPLSGPSFLGYWQADLLKLLVYADAVRLEPFGADPVAASLVGSGFVVAITVKPRAMKRRKKPARPRVRLRITPLGRMALRDHEDFD